MGSVDPLHHLRSQTDKAVAGIFGAGEAGDLNARKHRIQEGLRRADAARRQLEKDGLITLEAGENELLDVPKGSIASLEAASYGACDGSASVDVMKRVQQDLLSGRPIRVTNGVMGSDPKPGTRKVFRVLYKPSSTLVTITTEEGKALELPAHGAEGVCKATYGVGEVMQDVTLELQGALLEKPGQRFVVSNEALGGDPAPGKIKVLTVQYDPSRTRQSFKLQTGRELATFGLISPWHFGDFCRRVGLSLDDFYSSLTDHELTGGEKQVSGKSGEVFWFSTDRRFVLKTIADSEIATLVRMLQAYTAFLGSNPDSMLTRYFGVFCLEDNGTTTQFVVMNNIFQGAPHLDVMYDLKGTTEDRWVDPESGGCLKDNNFADTTVYFNDDVAAGVHRAIQNDTKFLEKHGIMDYSLMVAIARDGGTYRRPAPPFSQFMGGLRGTEATGVTEETVGQVTVFLGMVDMLVEYGWKKVAAHVFKRNTVGLKEEIDTVAPDRYASRFRSYFGVKLRGSSEQCVVSTVSADPFETPMPALGRSGGTAAFFKATYREGAPDPEAQESRNYWIGKDLARAKDEVTFYEVSKDLQGTAGYEVLSWMTPYRGVVRCLCDVQAGKEPKPVDVMLIRNGRDGYTKCRMLDIKIGQVTAVAGWQGKSALSAWKQTTTIDAMTNSAGQGFRLEGFDEPPETLRTFEELLTEQKLMKVTTIKPDRVRRFNLQRMTACQFASYFLDLHEVETKNIAGDGVDPSSTFVPPTRKRYPEPELLTRLETQELVLLSTIEELAHFVAACNKVAAPQQWIGSSVMFCFDSGTRPSRQVLSCGPRKWGVSRVHIFDWGRSELNLAAAHKRLEVEAQAERSKYWGYYCGAIGKLLYDCCSLYISRYWHPKKSVALTVWDKDQFTPDDLIGTAVAPVPVPGGCTTGKMELLNFAGSQVTSGFLRGTAGTVSASVKPMASAPGSRLEQAYTVTVHKAENLPQMDTISPNDCFVEVTSFPEEPSAVREAVKKPEAQGLLREGAHLTSLKIDQTAPRWEEEFEIGSLTEGARAAFLQALGVAFGKQGSSLEELGGMVGALFRRTVGTAVSEQEAAQCRTEFIKHCFRGQHESLFV